LTVEHVTYCCQGDLETKLDEFTDNLAVTQVVVL
jgi:hypothetical protein